MFVFYNCNRRRIVVTLLSIGFGNALSQERIISILTPDSAPVKRLVHIAKESGNLIDATCGRKTQSVIIMDSDHVITSAMSAEVLAGKINSINHFEEKLSGE